jgi:hypothetical protein
VESNTCATRLTAGSLDAVAGDLIYHYTGLEGLQGILEKKQLRATDVEFLNDTSEATFARHKLDELLAMETKARFPRPEALKVFQVAWRSIIKDPPRLFVACFCINGDPLSQWRGYGRGGYSIGFDRDVHQQLGGQGPVGFFLRDMLYTEAERRPKVTAIVDQFMAEAPPQIHGLPIGAMDPAEAIHAIMPWAFAYSGDLYTNDVMRHTTGYRCSKGATSAKEQSSHT